ncbi:hypothetical protein RHMOL_Rhmol04G0138200 [Rhododendron molle]|uniref:Uncharacterized protein n=1 Tax=Rhododendron molle TaxID=49168 RepID=A0ACC0P1C3_RHOML|nr:hypothetical protein RHMOL_Rhmol04G0138200 [Rhododendron molle]
MLVTTASQFLAICLLDLGRLLWSIRLLGSCCSYCNMVVRVPFRRWLHVKHRNLETRHGGFYCLLLIEGRRVIAVVARYPRPAQLEYKAYSIIVREYGEILGLGENLIWAVREDLIKWMDALVHNSYMRHSTPGSSKGLSLRGTLKALEPSELVDSGIVSPSCSLIDIFQFSVSSDEEL